MEFFLSADDELPERRQATFCSHRQPNIAIA